MVGTMNFSVAWLNVLTTIVASTILIGISVRPQRNSIRLHLELMIGLVQFEIDSCFGVEGLVTDLAIVVGGEAKRRGPSPPNGTHVFSGAPQPGLCSCPNPLSPSSPQAKYL